MLPLSSTEEHVGTASTMPKRKLNQGLKKINTETARHWDQRILRKAFLPNAWAKRNYKKRTAVTRARKEQLGKLGKALYQGKRDLVETGLLMESVTDARHRITANKGQATVWIPGPSYFRDRIAHEVLHFTPGDSEELNKMANDKFGKFLNESKHRSTFKTKG